MTYDALFKYTLSDDEVRTSFLHAFVPRLSIKNSKRIDEHINPFEQFQILRDFIHRKETSDVIMRSSKITDIMVVSGGDTGSPPVPYSRGTEFLKELVSRYDEIKLAFPLPKFNGTMDFVCRLDNGEYAMVEMQVFPKNHWDRRALAYVAGFYGNQLRKGADIKQVIGINILGGGKDDLNHWEDTPNEYVLRHYKFQEQLHNTDSKSSRHIDGIELIQYSYMNALKRKETSLWKKQNKKNKIGLLSSFSKRI